MQEQQHTNNSLFNTILMDVLRALYGELGTSDMSASLEVSLKFDDAQRVISFDNLLVNNLPKIPSFEVTTKINQLTSKLLELPEKYKLKECKLGVKAGGAIDIQPTYLLN